MSFIRRFHCIHSIINETCQLEGQCQIFSQPISCIYALYVGWGGGAIKQLYNGVHVTVFSVYYLSGVFAKHLQKQLKVDTPAGEEELWKFTDQEVLCAEIAGLCHDLGTYSMSCKNVIFLARLHGLNLIVYCALSTSICMQLQSFIN